MSRSQTVRRSLAAAVAALALAACSSTASSGGAGDSDSLTAVKDGTATAAQLTEVVNAAASTPTPVNVTMEQSVDLGAAAASLPAELATLADYKTVVTGTMALDGSAGELTIELPGMGDAIPGLENGIKIQIYDGAIWVNDPISGEWQKDPNGSNLMETAQSLSGKTATQLMLPGQTLTYQGTEEVGGATAHKYTTEATITEEALTMMEGLGLGMEGLDAALGETVEAAFWVGDDGMPLKMESRVSAGKMFVSVLGGAPGSELLEEAHINQTWTWSDFGKGTLPTAPPVSGA